MNWREGRKSNRRKQREGTNKKLESGCRWNVCKGNKSRRSERGEIG